MSILEMIKQAESYAEEQKQQAMAVVQEKQEQLKLEAAATIRALFEDIEKQEQNLIKRIKQDMEKKTDEINTMVEADDTLILDQAAKKIDRAVHHVLKKVVTQ
jgi:hypothetical protein